ncbi:DUF2851 family protein [Flagellimonas myxillae]|uniref:DUF2851 family protein n=1 Tax=Flagellimonas myxillae TaxID=2942214 RepID=UPI00201F0F77|nr:DUF2851 family protein [Muricauda myxillae]MCL6267986.1 DUF2851 family protein [Muricauda myxillae]
MKEDLLHFIWRCDKLQGRPLTTTTSQNIVIKNPGTPNRYAGPDFFNASVEVGGQLWAGNVEMHLKSSDWYAHHHETDANYDNVILHVVWEDDISIFRKDGTLIPTLELKNHVAPTLLKKYQELFRHFNPAFINCERDFSSFDAFMVDNFMERLYLERLEQKSKLIFMLLQETNNDWEAVLFAFLTKSFGTKVNGDFFLQRALQLPFSIIRKESKDATALESLFFGFFGLLDAKDCSDAYFEQLRLEFQYLGRKYELDPCLGKPDFFGLRPANFPTIRLSQLANLYANRQNLFAVLMETDSLERLYKVLQTSSSVYWHDHFTFGRTSRKRVKKLSRDFMDLLVINTLVPIKFCYAKHLGRDWSGNLITLVSEVKGESNSIIKNFETLGSKTKNALESQAKIQLYREYCSKNKCLQCTLGSNLLNRNT